jgi:hypothetical protein
MLLLDRLQTNFKDALRFELANGWQARSILHRIMIRLHQIFKQQLLKFSSDDPTVHKQLGDLMVKQYNIDRAVEYYDRSLALSANPIDLSLYYNYLRWEKQRYNQLERCDASNSSYTGKINFGEQRVFDYHRSGWGFAVRSLGVLHDPHGCLFDGFIENNFLYQLNYKQQKPDRVVTKMRADGVFDDLANVAERQIIPYRQPWVGFLHNPQAIPHWFCYENAPQQLFETEIWRSSLPHCVGLFCLSHYMGDWLREQTGKPVSVLTYPTEIPDRQFEFDRFLANPQKKVVQIGWWLRKLNSIYQLPLDRDNPLGYEKVALGLKVASLKEMIANLMSIEQQTYNLKIEDRYQSNTTLLGHVSDDEYDDLLSLNIAFIDLYDTSANTGIVECIARATPLLINPLPAVKEYLGEDYPMYFHTLAEAAEKAVDTVLIFDTHQYLKSCETRKKLSPEYFVESFCNSEVYRLL